MIRVAERLGLLKLDRIARRRAATARASRRVLPVRLPRLVLVLSSLGAAVGAIGLARVQVEYDHRVLRPINRPNEILDSAKQAFGETFTPTLLMAPSRAELRAALDAIERQRERLGSRSTVRRTSSILDLVPPRQPEKRVLLEELDQLLSSKRWNLVSDAAKDKIAYERLRRMAEAEPFGLRDLPEDLRRSFRGPGFGDTWLAMVYYNINISDTRQARRFKAEVGRFDGSRLLSVPRLLPEEARVWIEGRRVEVACPDPLSATCQRALSEAQHDGKPLFARVTSAEQAVGKELAIEGGLRGSIVAWARNGLVPVARRLEAPVMSSGTFRVSSSELVLTEVIEVMLHDGRIAFVLALLVVFLACLVDLRSFGLAALACLPLVFGLLWTFGLLHLLGLKLNMFNFVVLPALLGIGIDYGVHLVHRHREEGTGGIPRVRGALFWVLVTCACTSIIGFGNMSLASHTGLRSLGILAIIGLLSILVAATYTLPTVLDWLDLRREQRERSYGR
jgi:predicted RND superfamily exporter protein